jgi:methionine synthase II (cobalamin-independent)
MAGGHASTYTEETADEICQRIAAGESVLAISSDSGMPSHTTIYKWLFNNPEFADKYARAREAQADVYAQQIVDIADAATDAGIARLQMDARKWAASKLAAKKYGDKLDLQHAGANGGPIQTINRILLVSGEDDGEDENGED